MTLAVRPTERKERESRTKRERRDEGVRGGNPRSSE